MNLGFIIRVSNDPSTRSIYKPLHVDCQKAENMSL